ncbi:hypothetical protein OESDEN_18539, partial [Oesophagostomum dentatum]
MKHGDESPASYEAEHTPSKIAKDDPCETESSLIEGTDSMDIKQEAFEEEKNLIMVEGFRTSEEEKQKKETVDCDLFPREENLVSMDAISQKAESEEEKISSVIETAEIDDMNSSSVSSETSGIPQMELDCFEMGPSTNASDEAQECTSAEQIGGVQNEPMENGALKAEENHVQKKEPSSANGNQSNSSSPPDRPSSSPPEHPSSSSPLERPSSSASRSSTHESGAVEFNSELRCEHGGVNLDEFRQAVSPEEWKQLSSYFDASTTFL